MRKTLNINLGGLAFIIDENAFELLHNYLEALKQKFSNQQERDEIMNDIEARIAELLSQHLGDRKEIVSLEEVQVIINAMGRPEDIAGEETPPSETSSSSGTGSTTTNTNTKKVKRKLFRDPDDKVIGGVISGLCHYFGINDPVWIRIAFFVFMLLSFFSGFVVYLLLWIIVPEAKNAADKLQMKGEPINILTIEKEIIDAANKAGASIHRIVKDQNFFERLWDIIRSLVTAVLKVAGSFIIVVSTIGLMACFFAFYVISRESVTDASLLVVNDKHTATLLSIGFLLVVAIPFITLIYVSLKAVVGRRSRVPALKWVLSVAWWLGFMLLLISGFHIANQFKTDSTIKQQISLAQPGRGTLAIQIADSTGKKYTSEDEAVKNFSLDMDGLTINGVNLKDMTQICLGHPTLQLIPSDNDSFYIQEIITSRGHDKHASQLNAEMVTYSIAQTDSLLRLSPYYYIPKNAKWRNQELKICIAVPKGRKIAFDNNIDFWEATVKGDSKYDDTQFANTVWTNEAGQINCLSGENHKHGEHKTVVTQTKNKKDESASHNQSNSDKKEDDDKSSDDF